MLRHQTTRKRPKLEDAHAYRRTGSAEPSPRYGDKERMANVQRTVEDVTLLLRTRFPRTANLEYAVLKCHLIMEHVLTEYIRHSSHVLVDADEIHFSFSQKLNIAFLMGVGTGHITLIPTLDLLNSVRNQAAHTFEIDRKKVDEIIRLNHEDYPTVVIANDRQRVSYLRKVCYMLVGGIIGFLEGAAFGYSLTDDAGVLKDADET